MKSITIIGRRWFQKSYGNTYHTVNVLIDGKLVHESEKHYGYGSQYEQTAQEWLVKSGNLKCKEQSLGGYEPLRIVCERLGIAYHNHVTDVTRERDL